MPSIKPIKRKALIHYLKQFGFEGPYAGGNHQYMMKEQLKIWIPNPHKGDISKSLLKKILQQANISQEEWERLKWLQRIIYHNESLREIIEKIRHRWVVNVHSLL